jgi:hypothetical protein
MTRRSAGEGNIRERPNGRWEARYVAADGRSRSIYARTKREATDRLRDALRDADHGVRPVSQQLTTGAYLDEWLESLTVRPRTAESYRHIVRRYLEPTIGRLPLAKLQPEHVTRLLRDLGRQDDPVLSPTTIRYVYVVLRIALGRALKLGRVHRNVAMLIDAPAKERPERTPMSAEQAGRSSHRWRLILRPTGRRTGSRRSTDSPSRQGSDRVSCSAFDGRMSTWTRERSPSATRSSRAPRYLPSRRRNALGAPSLSMR